MVHQPGVAVLQIEGDGVGRVRYVSFVIHWIVWGNCFRTLVSSDGARSPFGILKLGTRGPRRDRPLNLRQRGALLPDGTGSSGT